MRKKLIPLFLIIIFLGWGLSCGRHHRSKDETQSQTALTQESERDLRQEEGRYQAVGRGFAQKAFGRRGRRGWGPNDVVELSRSKQKKRHSGP
jgi:hypothetical protein